jgi:hypothetical protein
LKEIITELGGRIPALRPTPGQEPLQMLTVVEGSLLPALPKMAWAFWLDAQHRAAKMHLSFEVLRGIPLQATVTAGNASEHEQFRVMLQAGRLSCMDRGYAEYLLFQQILDAQSSFSGRIRARPCGRWWRSGR